MLWLEPDKAIICFLLTLLLLCHHHLPKYGIPQDSSNFSSTFRACMLPPGTIMFNYLLNARLLYFFTYKGKIFLHLKGKQVCGGAVDNKNVG